jgi:CDGSH iron-sulfur domain-containing protein 3
MPCAAQQRPFGIFDNIFGGKKEEDKKETTGDAQKEKNDDAPSMVKSSQAEPESPTARAQQTQQKRKNSNRINRIKVDGERLSKQESL